MTEHNYRKYSFADCKDNKELKKCQIIHELYKQQRMNINYVKNQDLLDKYTTQYKTISNFWSVFSLLDNIIDLSDPDTSLPNSIHALQTAEAIRNSNKKYPDWMHLIGLIHDLGKIIYINGCDDDGTSRTTQWGIVGDTFITGCALPDTLVLPEYNKYNADHTDHMDIYNMGCGLRNCSVSFGHDEYLYHLLIANNHKMPEEAEYIIRYHSLYAWHSSDAYDYLEDSTDKKMKTIVKEFNSFDLYSKNDNLPIKWTPDLKYYYSELVKKYINPSLLIRW